MKLSNRKLAIIALIFVNIIWGASFPIYKWTLDEIPTFTFVFIRFFFGALLLLPFAINKLILDKKDILRVFIASISGISLCISFLFMGLRLAPSINSSIIMSSSPIILILVAIFYFKEKPKRKVVFGTLISLMGILTIILRPLFENGLNLAILGNFLFLLATIGGIIHTLILEKIMKRYAVVTIAFWTFIFGSIPLLPLVVNEYNQYNFIDTLSMQGIIGAIYGVIFSTLIGHMLFAYGVRYIMTSEVGIFGYIDPIATVLIAYPLLGEGITISFILGALLVFGGIYIAEGRIHYHPIHLLRNKELKE